MQNVGQEVPVKRLAGRAALGLALSASALSLVSAWFVPLGRLWPSVAWAVVACVAGLWAIQIRMRPTPVMSDVIAGTEAEPPHAALAPAPGRIPGGALS